MKYNQEVFDNVLAAMRKQRKQSLKNGRCCYRGLCGCKCPIGHLIPDEDYSEDFEGNSVFKRCVLSAVGEYLQLNHYDLHFLMMLQLCHDKYDTTIHTIEFIDFYESKMQAVAALYDLNYTAAP